MGIKLEYSLHVVLACIRRGKQLSLHKEPIQLRSDGAKTKQYHTKENQKKPERALF